MEVIFLIWIYHGFTTWHISCFTYFGKISWFRYRERITSYVLRKFYFSIQATSLVESIVPVTMSDSSGDTHHRRHTSKSSHLAGGRTEPVLNPEMPVPRWPAIERLGAQPQTTAQSHDLKETLNARRQPDLRDRISSRHEQEAEPVVQEIVQLKREVEKLKKQQELSKKWLRLRTEFQELG